MIKLAARCVGIILILGMPVWSSGANGADDTHDRAASAAIAQELCSGCHIVAEGQRGPVPDGVPPFAAVASQPGRTTGYLQAYLSDLTPPMPHVPLSKREVDSIIAYIRSFAD